MDTETTQNIVLQEALSHILYKWLKLHVLGIDKRLEDFVLRSDLE